jgi:hypothetical protein
MIDLSSNVLRVSFLRHGVSLCEDCFKRRRARGQSEVILARSRSLGRQGNKDNHCNNREFGNLGNHGNVGHISNPSTRT